MNKIFSFLNMAPFFTLFCDRKTTDRQLEVVKTLEKYYSCFIDSETEPLIIKNKYKGSNHRFFSYDKTWMIYKVDVVDLIQPEFVLTFDQDATVTKDEWNHCLEFIKTIFSEEPNESTILQMYDIVPKAPIAEKISIVPKKEVVKQNNEYLFSHKVDKEKDILYCQIDKPFTDRPYTCVIDNYSKVGFLPVFTAFYICTSWGVAPADHIFLAHLWKYLEMKEKHGDFNLEQRLKDDIDECANGKPEPRVYRQTIEEVIELFKQKELAIEESKV